MNLTKISQLELNKYTNITIHNSDNEKLILDLRTYICANGDCMEVRHGIVHTYRMTVRDMASLVLYKTAILILSVSF